MSMTTNKSARETAFRRGIMRRVQAIWFLRRLFHPMLVKLYILAIVAAELATRISVPNVLANAPGVSDPWRNVGFFTSAFMKCDPIIKVFIALGGIMILWLIYGLLVPRGRPYNGTWGGQSFGGGQPLSSA